MLSQKNNVKIILNYSYRVNFLLDKYLKYCSNKYNDEAFRSIQYVTTKSCKKKVLNYDISGCF